MNFQRYFFLLLRYSWLIVLITGLAVAYTWVKLGKQPNIYASRATLEVEKEQAKIVNIQDVKEDRVSSGDDLNTVIHNLTTNTLMLDVARRIGRTAEWAARNPSGQITPAEESSLAGSVRGHYRVALRSGTRLIDIVAEDTDPEKARVLAATLVDAFLDSLSEDRDTVSRGANTFLLDEAKKLKAKLEESEQQVVKYRQETNAISVDQSQEMITQQLSDLNTQVSQAASQRATLEVDLKALEAVQPDQTDVMLRLTSVASLPEVATARTALNAKEAEFVALQERYLELHPKFIAAQGELNDLRAQLKSIVSDAGDTLRQQYVKIVETEKKFKEMLAEYEQKSLDLERTAIPYKVLQREAASDRQLYEAVLTRLKETNVTQGLTKTPYRVIEEPLVNSWPVRPDRKKSLMNAGLMALVAGVGLILLLDYLDSSIRTVDEAESELELPVLAALPEMPQSKMPKDGVSIMNHAPASSVAESFRNLRSSISLLGDAEHRRVFLLSSAIPSEGKTFTSFNLAVSLASQGLRVLLVDADLRRPALSSLLLSAEQRKADDYRGLTDVLSGLAELGTTIRETSVKNLWLLPAGRRAPNPAELLAQPQSAKLISAVAKSFNRVVIDSAPINAVSDTLSLAAHADCMFLVLRFGKTPRRAVQHAIKLLVNAGAKIGGLVLNRMPTGRSAAYYYYYYGDTYVKDSVYGSSHDRKEAKDAQDEKEGKNEGSRKRRSKTSQTVATVGDSDD